MGMAKKVSQNFMTHILRQGSIGRITIPTEYQSVGNVLPMTRGLAKFGLLLSILLVSFTASWDGRKVNMSADNWTECPNCRVASQHEIEKLRIKLIEEYGKLPQAEYLGLHNELQEKIKMMRESRPAHSLREDSTSTIWADGVLHIEYDASCKKCKYRVTYKQTFDTFKTQYSRPVYSVDM